MNEDMSLLRTCAIIECVWTCLPFPPVIYSIMRISRQPFPVKIIIDQKQLENVESLKYLGSILTNDGRCTCEIKCRIAMAKAAFNKKRSLFTSTLDLELRKKLVKCYV